MSETDAQRWIPVMWDGLNAQYVLQKYYGNKDGNGKYIPFKTKITVTKTEYVLFDRVD